MLSRTGNNKKQIIAWLTVILWILLIFTLSAQPTEQTNNLSIGVTERIMSTEVAIDIDTMDTSNPIVQWNAVLRKIAHFSLFLVLGSLGSYAVLLEDEGVKIKKIVLEPGAKFSKQMRYQRNEHWIVVKGIAKLVNGDSKGYYNL